MSLILNGIEAMEGTGGELRLESQSGRWPSIDLGQRYRSGLLAENLDNIFNAFFTTKTQSLSIIESHGGRTSATASSGRCRLARQPGNSLPTGFNACLVFVRFTTGPGAHPRPRAAPPL